MEKYTFYPTNISTNIFFNTGKNSLYKKFDYKFNTIFSPESISQSKNIQFFPLKRTFSDLTLTNLHYNKDNFFNSYINNFKEKEKMKILKLNPIINRRKYNNELKNYNSEFIRNKNFFSRNFKKKMNQSAQYDFYYDKEIEKKYNIHQNSLIDYFLNKKMKINKRPKIIKLNLDKSNIIENIIKYCGKDFFLKKFEKKYLHYYKPVHHYLKNKNIISKSSDKKSNIFSLIKKNNNYLNNKNYYEIVEFGDKKQKVAKKLIIDENEKNINNNLDCHSLMKYPNSHNNSIYNSNSNVFSKCSSYMKSIKFKSKNKDNRKISFDELKLLSQKGLKRMKKIRYDGFSKIIDETLEEVKSNRKKYDSLLEINLKIFNKNKEEILNNDL